MEGQSLVLLLRKYYRNFLRFLFQKDRGRRKFSWTKRWFFVWFFFEKKVSRNFPFFLAFLQFTSCIIKLTSHFLWWCENSKNTVLKVDKNLDSISSKIKGTFVLHKIWINFVLFKIRTWYQMKNGLYLPWLTVITGNL